MAMALFVAACGTAGAAEPLKIGLVESLTGPFSVSGTATAFAVQAEVDKINSAGGLLGRPIKVVLRDSASDPSKALSATNGLLFNDNVDVMMGPGSSGEAFPIMDIVANAKKMFITPTQADPLIDPAKRPYTYRGMPTIGSVAARTVAFTSDTVKGSKIAIFADSTGYGTVIADALKTEYAKAGVKLLSVTLINTNQADVTPELNKAKNAGADLIEVWTSATGLMARILNARGELGWNVPVVGHSNLVGKEVRNLVDNPGYLKDVYGITYSATIYDDAGKLPPLAQQFVDLAGPRLEQYSNAPLFVPLTGAAIVQIYAAGVTKANSFDADKVAAALNTMGPIPTSFGTFTYSPTDHTGFALDSMDFVAAGSEHGYGNTRLKLPLDK
jgi:branched-chain amino acid transport system substrate-binding protein